MIESLNRGVSKLSVTLASKGEDIFYPFPKLPTEIRLQIWQRAIDALPGRIIDVTSVIHQNESGHEYRFVSHRACPSLAGVNREARATVFKIYTPLFPPGTKHSFITACLEKDTILLSTGTRHPKYIWRQNFLMKFVEALGEEKCREFRTLALEPEMNWQWGRWSISRWQMCPWLTIEPRHNTFLLRQLFQNIEKVVFVPLIKGSANAHVGELEFVGPESGTWSTRVKKFTRAATCQLPREDLKFEFMQLGIVGGSKKLQWDPVRRDVYWRRMTEEEIRDKEAKLSMIEERRSFKLEAKTGKVAATELVGARKIS